MAAEHWLASAHPNPAEVRAAWTASGLALLPLGTLLSAVRLPGELVLALTGGTAPSPHVDEALGEVLEGGPVICDPRGRRYYALVPASMPATWHVAAAEWRADEVDCLGRYCYLGVPRLDLTALDPDTYASYWSVPMASAASLCAPLGVARLIAAALHQLGRQREE
ncbi:hypothetical protein ACF08A_25540 [Streptomyces cellulosae]